MKGFAKLLSGDKVAILSPSFAAPGKFPAVYDLGLQRLREVLQLEPVEFPTTRKLGASKEERSQDLIAAFENPDIKAVIATIGGDDQVTYVKDLPSEPFTENPKPFFGNSDNSHFMNFLWLNGIPSYYGGSIMTQYAMQGSMDDYTVQYLKYALFKSGEVELKPSDKFNDVGLDWGDETNLSKQREHEENDGWYWDGDKNVTGITWGGCLESIGKIFRHGVRVPTLEDFENVVLFTETSEEIPTPGYVAQVYRELGDRGILERVQAVLVGRPKAWEFDKPQSPEQRRAYREQQRKTIIDVVREYNPAITIIQNMDFGHTDPQIPLPYGANMRIDTAAKKLFAEF